MHIRFFHSLLSSEFCILPAPKTSQTNAPNRSNPAIAPHAADIFKAIALALEAETLQGNTARKVADAAKALAQSTGLDANAALAGMSPEGQAAVKAYCFSPSRSHA